MFVCQAFQVFQAADCFLRCFKPFRFHSAIGTQRWEASHPVSFHNQTLRFLHLKVLPIMTPKFNGSCCEKTFTVLYVMYHVWVYNIIHVYKLNVR